MTEIQKLSVDCIRVLSAEAIQKAKSGHPGLPMGAAPIGYALFNYNLRFNPRNPKWENRDRFILSAGHGSMLLYSLLHLYGYDLSMDDIKNFRQLGAKTAGHPEIGHIDGVETTTGPLGQGFANGVGMAMAEAHLAAKFNRPNLPLVDHYTYVLVGDGCIQEGISYEAASFAGANKLGKLIVLYDSNSISIEGGIDVTFRENVRQRFAAQGWHTLYVEDANDIASINRAIGKAKKITDKPHLIICNSVIGYGSPFAGSEVTHGAPLGEAALLQTKANLGWTYPPFTVPYEVKEANKLVIKRCVKREKKWNVIVDDYKEKYPKDYAEYQAALSDDTFDFSKDEQLWNVENTRPDATRNSSSIVLNRLADRIPKLFGGSADLAPANKCIMNDREDFTPENMAGSNVHFGIREHAMAAICNGLSLHGGVLPYCATFLVFMDYMKNAIRMSALMKQQVLYIFSHDSIGVGEDGPTHQPIEHLASLRSVPNLKVFRPCNASETVAAYVSYLYEKMPCAIILTRQVLPPVLKATKLALKGGYILADSKKAVPDLIVMATGSEVSIALAAHTKLFQIGIDARIVSMPCLEVFDSQSQDYKEHVLPSEVKMRIAIEAGSTMPWYKYVGTYGKVIGIDQFGVSAPYEKLFPLFGFTSDNIVTVAERMRREIKTKN